MSNVTDLNAFKNLKDMEKFTANLMENYLKLEKRVVFLEEKLAFLETFLVTEINRRIDNEGR